MAENDLFTKKDTEISLIDLIAVVIRYRKFILLFTLICTVIYSLWISVLPKVFPSLDKKKVTVVCSVSTPTISKALIEDISFDPKKEALSVFKNIMNFSEFQRDFNVFSWEGISETEYNTLMMQLFDGKLIYFDEKKGDNLTVNAVISKGKVSEYKDFVVKYVEFCSNLINGQMKEKLIMTGEKADSVILKYDGIKDSPVDVSKYISLKMDVDYLLNSDMSYLSVSANPYEISPKENLTAKIIKMAVLFLAIGIIISYFMCFIQRIKQNPEKSKIISDAWKAGK